MKNIFSLKRRRPIHKFPRPNGVIPSEKIRLRQKTLNKKTLVVFLIGLGFFTLSMLAYRFKNVVPSLDSDTGALVRPDTQPQDSTAFKNELVANGIQFESLTYATQSSTLIVKMPYGAYAYLNTVLDPSSQVHLLANILSRVTIENKGKTLKYIDLTHEKAIVKF